MIAGTLSVFLLVLCLYGINGQNTVISFGVTDSVLENVGTTQICVSFFVGTNAQETTVNVTSIGTEAGPNDFSPPRATIVFTQMDIMGGSNPIIKCFNVTIVDDDIVENFEQVIYGFDGTDPVVDISVPTESFSITDNDQPARFSVVAEEITVSDSNATVTMCLMLTGPPGGLERDVSVIVIAVSGTAIRGNDFLFEVLGEAVMFSGVTMVGGQACILVVLENDARVDGDKEFQLMIETSTAYAIDQPSTTNVTITDDDNATLTVFLNPTVPTEGTSFATCVQISVPAEIDVTVDLMISGDVDSNDFPDLTFSINLSAGSPFGCTNILPTSDNLFEGNEELIVTITNSVPSLIFSSPVTTELLDGDTANISFAMASYQFTEGDVIANTMVCIDIVDVPSAGTAVDLVVSVGVIDSTTIRCNAEGNARTNIDFSIDQSVTFPATSNGVPPQQCITVMVINDSSAEDNETILLEITSTDPPNTNIVNNVNTEVTIIDNDEIVVSIDSGNESVLEDVGSVDVIIVLAGSAGNLERNLSISIMDTPNTALNPDDYTLPATVDYFCSEDLTLGTPESEKMVPITIVDDLLVENDESFVFQIDSGAGLDNVVISVLSSTVTITIMDDEFSVGFTVATITVSETMTDVQLEFSVVEGTPRRYTMFDVTAGMNSTATVVDDYVIDSPTFVLGPDTLTAFVNVSIINDNLTEEDELLQLIVTANDTSAIIINDTVDITIDSDDVTFLSLTNSSNTVMEGGSVEICVVASGSQLEQDLSVELGTSSITANGAVFGADFVISTSITILSPATINCTDITIIADNVFEGFELFEVNISSVSLVDVEYEMPSELDITIVNINELNISIDLMMMSIPELDGSTTIAATIDSAPSAGSEIPVTLSLDFSTMSSATLDTDFSLNITEFEFMLPFTVDDLALILVSALDDQILEGNEDIVFSLVMDSISTLPGLTVNIVNNNITIIDDEGITIEFVEPVYNITEGENAIMLCLEPVSSTTIDFSIPINVSVDTVMTTIDAEICSGSGLASDADFQIDSTMLTFPPGMTTPQCISILAADDMFTEDIESFSLEITILSSTNTVTAGQPTIINIFDNNNVDIGLTVSELSIDENAGFVTVCSMLNMGQLCADAMLNVTFDNTTDSSPSAVVDEDFTIDPMTIVYAANSGMSECFNITIIDDMLVEPNELFNVSIVPVTQYPSITISENTSAIVTIINNDAAVRFTNQSFTAEEGNEGIVCVEIFEGQLLESTNVQINLENNGADAADYTFSQLLLTLGPDTTITCIDYIIVADNVKEVNESVSLRLVPSTPTVVIDEPVITITITSEDIAVIQFSNNSITVQETVGPVSVCVQLAGADLSADLMINIQTNDGPLAIVGSDYSISPSFVMFSAGSLVGSEQCVTVRIIDDDAFETDHSFSIFLVDPNTPLCTIGNPSQVEFTIIDDESVTVSFDRSNVTISEGDSSTVQVVLSGIPSGGLEIDVEVDILTIDGTGEAADITLSTTPVVFAAGPATGSDLSNSLTITAIMDSSIEEDGEQLDLVINDTNVIYIIGAEPSVTVTVISLDGATIAFEQPASTFVESTPDFPVCLEVVSFSSTTMSLEDDIIITLSFTNDTALEFQDYIPPTDPIIIITAGSVPGTTACATVSIVDDNLFEELSESFTISISSFSISTIMTGSQSTQTVTITDDELATISTQMVASVIEDGGDVTICSTLEGPADGLAIMVEVTADTVNDSAMAPDDYTAVTGETLTFSESISEVCVTVDIIDDDAIEGDEELFLDISSLNSRIVISNNRTTVTIIDNDLLIMFMNDSMSFSFPESDDSTFRVCLTVLQGMPSFDNEIFLTPDPSSTAMMGSDYELINNPLVINSTVTSGCIDVAVVNDEFLENDDFVSFSLDSSSPGIQFENGFLNLTIENDDFVQFEFRNTKYIVNETVNAQVCVRTVSGGGLVGPEIPITITLFIRNRTALRDLDFMVDPSSLELMFDGSTQMLCTGIYVIDDDVVETSEYFEVLFEYEGTTSEVEVVIYDPNVCPNVEGGSVCEDSIFLRICNTLRRMNTTVPRSCNVVLEEYTDISVQNDSPPPP